MYPIENRRVTVSFIGRDGPLELHKTRKRITKKQRKAGNDAIATLKGIGWLTPRQEWDKSEKIEKIEVRYDDLERFIMENHRDLMCQFGIKDTICLIGSRLFLELTRQNVRGPMMIPLSDFQCEHFQNRLHGMFVVILPWMEGTVLVPKEYFPIERQLVPSGVMVTAETQRKMDEDAEGRRAAALWNMAMGRDAFGDDDE